MKETLRPIYQKFFLILLVLCFVITTTSAFVPLWGNFVPSLGGSLKTVGIAVSLNYVTSGIFNFIFSFVEDRNKKYYFYVATALALSIAGWIAFIWVKNVTELYLVIILLGAGSGMLWPSFDALFSKNSLKNKEALSWGLYGAVESLSGGLGAIIGTHVVHYFNYHTLFITLAALNGITLLFLYLLLKLDFKGIKEEF